jgi:hypothetical protein
MDYKYLADMLFPDVKETPADMEEKYPPRNLPEGAIVSRMAPSPTGFVHLGNLVQGLTSERLSHQSGGVLFLRVEDTDAKREVKGAVETLIETLKHYNIKFDGAYSYYEGGSISTSQGAPVSLGLLEGDMNATNLCTVKFRNDCYKVAGVTPTPFYDVYRDWLWEELLNKKPVVKNIKPASGGSFSDDFESYELDKTPKTVIANTQSGAVKVVTDPAMNNNKVLMITSEEKGITSAAINMNEIGKSNKIEISFRLMIETGTPAPIYYIELGKKAMSLILDNSAGGDKFSFNYRLHDSEMGKTIASLSLDEWYNIKIEYEPKGLEDTVTKIYVDDELKCTTNDYYYGKNKGADPVNVLDYFRIAAWSNRAGTVYLDDIKIKAEEIAK